MCKGRVCLPPLGTLCTHVCEHTHASPRPARTHYYAKGCDVIGESRPQLFRAGRTAPDPAGGGGARVPAAGGVLPPGGRPGSPSPRASRCSRARGGAGRARGARVAPRGTVSRPEPAPPRLHPARPAPPRPRAGCICSSRTLAPRTPEPAALQPPGPTPEPAASLLYSAANTPPAEPAAPQLGAPTPSPSTHPRPAPPAAS